MRIGADRECGEDVVTGRGLPSLTTLRDPNEMNNKSKRATGAVVRIGGVLPNLSKIGRATAIWRPHDAAQIGEGARPHACVRDDGGLRNESVWLPVVFASSSGPLTRGTSLLSRPAGGVPLERLHLHVQWRRPDVLRQSGGWAGLPD